MKLHSYVLSGLLAGTAAVLLAPAEPSYGFTKIPTSLGIGQRDVRVFDNFLDSQSNNNVTGSSQFPGQLGAELAVWKACVEWGSGPHGTGAGDPTQASLGDGGANFDFAWMGKTEGRGSANDNILSANASCAAGVISNTEQPSSDGWRISLCDNGRVWADGPGTIVGTEFDIQSAAAHEFGHALGLGHSSDASATMDATILAGNVDKRSIEADDIAGVQCIYGVKSATKPVITSVTASGGALGITVVIQGTGFTPTNNDLWFTHKGLTNTGADPRVRIQNLTSSNGGTKITGLLPVTTQAGDGDCFVKISGQGGDKLSNGYPVNLP
jgi:hypothetical protein